MNPIKQIGRYQLPILNVVVVMKRDDGDGYDVSLTNGASIRFTEEEKIEYDKAIEAHSGVMKVYGMAKALGLRG